MVPPDSDGVSRVPSYLGYRWVRSGFRLRGFHPLWPDFPVRSPNLPGTVSRSRNPGRQAVRFGLVRFRSPLLAQPRLLSSPLGTEMFHFPRSRPAGLSIQPAAAPDQGCRVSPFGNPRIKARWRLPAAYRSLPRPSSPHDAKASVVRPYTLSKIQNLASRYVAILFISNLPVVKDQKNGTDCWLVEATGFEPVTSCLQSRRSTS